MIAEAEPRYYTPATIDRGVEMPNARDVEQFTQRKALFPLVEGVTVPFVTNGTSVVNGESAVIAKFDAEKRRGFDQAIKAVIYERTHDLFTDKGKVKEDRVQEWINVREIAPTIVKILLSEDNYIEAVSQENAANIVRFGIDASRNPKLLEKTVLNVGFGGSDSPYTSTRLEALTLPSMRIVRQFRDFYNQREASEIQRKRGNTKFTELVAEYETRAGAPAGKEEKIAIRAYINTLSEADLPQLTDDEIAQVKSEYGIPDRMPTARFFFAGEAASSINHTMDPAGIRVRTDESIATLQGYLADTFPNEMDSVEIIQDTPWSEHSFSTKLMIEYCAKVLRDSEDENIQRTLQRLERQGNQHGGENGKEMAAEYASIHPLLFQEAVDLPFAQFLNGVNNPPLVNISIGGRPEKQFNHLREYLSKHVSADGFMTFIQGKIAAAEPQQAVELQKTQRAMGAWKERIDRIRDTYTPNMDYSVIPRPDRPLITIKLITGIGDSPTYYLTPFDQPRGVSIEDQIVALQTSDDILEAEVASRMEKGSQKEADVIRLELNAVREGVIFDLRALQAQRSAGVNQ